MNCGIIAQTAFARLAETMFRHVCAVVNYNGIRRWAAVTIDFSEKEFRRLLDLVYIGDWILNSARGEDRFEDYDDLLEKLFSLCPQVGMHALMDYWNGHFFPSKAYREGGIHEAIADYEDAVFFDILAEELARRDMEGEGADANDENELENRMEEYYQEFEQHGIDNLTVDN